MAIHRISPAPETTRWGTFDAAYPPLVTINTGDSVVLECLSAGGPDVMPQAAPGLMVHSAYEAIFAAHPGRSGGHILTGPIAVSGAEPGDMLEVRIDTIELGADWGFCGFRPLVGTLPEDFPERFLSHIPIDRTRRICRLPWGTELPLAPFFGVMGVAPPPEWGSISTKEPRAHGGNLDNKELTAGATLYLPVFVPGANFSAGDGHGVQGDGEVCINALETCLTGTFTLVLHKGGGARDPLLRYPRAETSTHWISMGMNEDLDLAMKQALREMIAFITGRANLSAQQAYQFCSLAVDFHVTQTVNGEKGVHGLLRKGLLF
ncbi:MAG TPA: acetamidase/formamidase family protein [Acetobacteraceae bacterium]|nr:acetamidase/formamidase family protein [Acetobacteraceae bacterium]